MQQVTTAGKAILITGCDSRVGYALAKQLDDLVSMKLNLYYKSNNLEPISTVFFPLLFKGFTVFAGFSNKAENEEVMQRLKDDTSGRLHVLQLDVTSERDIHSTFLYVNENLPDGAPGTSP